MLNWWRKDADAGLPERVRVAVRGQEDAAERLISWAQLGIVLTFGTLYILAPKPPGAGFAPVPWALTVYLALTLGRLAWAHLGRLPGWAPAENGRPSGRARVWQYV